jgi:hypothetical protein
LYALTPEGEKRWEPYSTNGALHASPALGADGTIYFPSDDGYFYALNPNGTFRWRTEYHATSSSSPAVRGDGVILFGADDRLLHALDPDGKERPSVEISPPDEPLVESSPVVGPDGSIYIGSFDGKLYKITGNGSPLSEYSSWPAFRRDIAHSGRARTITGSAVLKNLSARAHVEPGNSLIAGFYVQGPGAKAYLIRGVGPALAQFGIRGFMLDPFLRVYEHDQRLAVTNDDWSVDAAGFVGAFPLPEGSKDAALITAFFGSHTVEVSDVTQKGGVALVEAYDAASGAEETHLTNLATRGQVGTGDNVLIMGLAVSGTGPTRVLVRAVGPGLSQFGVTGVLQNPQLSVFDAAQKQLIEPTTTSWSAQGLTYDLQAAANLVAAFPLQIGSQDRARVLTLNPGTYTVQISGTNETVGEALAEIYVLP